ncbi:membrane fusion protein, adhesin transport system [Pseudovibrio denitrificans]|uniref:Membrane fusion protein (MFP) family protein n=1 Tax=Pseudovibrio denitrificans TaxID=258256 RepID=A0A1I7BV20_9HYPH|nr:HlyD family type I secretion periplasmic adaptor subunit [Pseudovibrio denitrificans]SFT91034.1 membrane fusion protein, adhesin transport system [Pseudovibrio denitrificans]
MRKWIGKGSETAQLPKGAAQVSAGLEHAVFARTRLLILLIGLLLVAFVVWASWAQLEEVTRSDGRIIPSAKIQVIQSLEGGIVKEVLVKTGDLVSKGDVLIRLDDTGFSSNLGELVAKQLALEIARERLEFQSVWPQRGEELSYTDHYQEKAPQIVASELSLFQANIEGLKGQVAINRSRVAQRMAELEASENQKRKLMELLRLANEERELKAPLAEKQIIPRTDMLKLQREIGDLEGQINTLQVTEGRLQAAVDEAEQEIESLYIKFRQAARAEMSEVQAQLDIITETSKGAGDKVKRAEIRAPMDGIVNTIDVSTIGGVASPSQQLMTIVPVEDILLVEAKVKPQDIAFIHQGQQALVKLSAYDFSIYGGLDGEVEGISADTVYDEVTHEQFYSVIIKTKQTELESRNKSLPILPGMVASVDILTGEKSVLSYILKPVNRAREEALRER